MSKLNILGKEGANTIIENPDKELVEKIKAVKIDDSELTYWGGIGGKTFEIVKSLNESQILCKRNDSKEYFIMKKSEIENLKNNLLKEKINVLYPVTKNSPLLGLSFGYRENDLQFTICGIETTPGLNGITESFVIEECNYNKRDSIHYTDCFEYIYSKGTRKLSASFNFDGNILVFGDHFYGTDILQENHKTKEDMLEEAISDIKDFIGESTEILFYGDKWYTDKFMLTIFENKNYKRISILRVPYKLTLSSGVVSYKGHGTTYNKPKTAVKVDVQTLIDAYKLKVEELWKQS